MTERPGLLSTAEGDERLGSREGLEALSERAMERATGTRGIGGNAVRLQFEGMSTFDAWLDAIDGARRFVHFENYILRDDRVGRAFRDALVAKARAGVPVRVLYDWIGSWATPGRYWKPFREAGVEVRAFNRPSVRDPLGVFQRDHRKLVCVDGEVAFVGGFCVGVEWAGRGSEPPWRDTGVEVRGPAAAAAGRAFERIWSELGDPVPAELESDPDAGEAVGSTPVWVIEGEPGRSRVYRTLSLVAAHARESLWLTDPYFVAPRPVSEALSAAARDGVDVRILLPGHNNWPWVGSLSRGGYRSLLEAGVRLFEWQGPMIHAKTAVADGLWCRVGSSNLNTASLLGNWEIDVGVLEGDLGGQLEGLFLADLASAVEIVLPRRHVALERARSEAEEVEIEGTEEGIEAAASGPVGEKSTGGEAEREDGEPVGDVRAEERRAVDVGSGRRIEPDGRRDSARDAEPPKHPLEPQGTLPERLERQIRAQIGRTGSGSTGWRLADLVRAGTAFGDALAGHRPLGREDRTVLGTVAGAVLVLAVVAALLPRLVGWGVAFVLGWAGLVVGTRAFLQARRARAEEKQMLRDIDRAGRAP